MKKLLLIAAIVGFTAINHTIKAQVENPEAKEQKEQKENQEIKELKEAQELKEQAERKETQEIIIRKKGDKDVKINIEIKGDKVTINGKPISDFKDDNIVINKRNMKVWGQGNSFSTRPDIKLNYKIDLDNNIKNKIGKKAFLGVTTQEQSGDGKSNGALITEVTKESAAEKAGLKEGDIITKINDKIINGPKSLSEVITSYKPKDVVTVYFNRNGKENSAKATLAETSSYKMAYSFAGPDGNMPYTFSWDDNEGMQKLKQLGEMNNQFDAMGGQFDRMGDMFPRHQKLGLKIQDTEDGTGVKVLEAEKDSPAQKAGLQKDDVITEIGGQKVNNTDEAREQLQENAEKSLYNIKAKRNGNEMSFDIKIPKKLKTADL